MNGRTREDGERARTGDGLCLMKALIRGRALSRDASYVTDCDAARKRTERRPPQRAAVASVRAFEGSLWPPRERRGVEVGELRRT